MNDEIFGELRLGRSYVRYMKNGKVVFSGKDGRALFAHVMNVALFQGRGNPLPGMAVVHKKLKGSAMTINPENRPETELSKLNRKLAAAKSEPEYADLLKKIHHARRHAVEAEWDIADQILKESENAPV
jgi:hypothetical protein